MNMNNTHQSQVSGEALRITKGDRLWIGKGLIPASCTLMEENSVTGTVLWIPRAHQLPILEIKIPCASSLSIGSLSGMFVNDTNGAVVVQWHAEE